MNVASEESQASMGESFRALVRGSWEATSGVRPRFFAFVFLFVIAYTVDLLVPWAIGYTLGVFVKDGFTDAAFNDAMLGIGAYVGLKLLYNLCHHGARYLQLTAAFSARMDTLEKIFAKLLGFPLTWHVHHHSGESLSRLHRSVGAVDAMIATYVWQIIEGSVKIVFASVAIFALDTWVAINVFGMGLLTILMMVLFNKRLTSYIRQNNKFYDRLNRVCVDYLYNIVTIKSLNLERTSQQYLGNIRPEGRVLISKIAAFGELKWGSVGVGYSLVIGTSLLIYFHNHQGFSGALDVAQVYVLLNYLDRIFQAIGSFTGYYSGIIESSTAFEDATKIFREARALPVHAADENQPLEWNSLTVKELEFQYARGEISGIRAQGLVINRGDKIALVGPSGSGKSTLLKMLGGMLTPERAELVTNHGENVSVERIAKHSLLLPQEPEIFSETVRYNLTMGEKFRLEELHFFLSLCRVDEVLERLPGTWDASLAEKGLNLSVGEKQRFAMARGLLRASQKQFLLLDEPTSSLDPLTEKQIFYGILHHFSDRTIMTACHRLALVPLFDKIVFIRRGQIEEVGTFAELLAKKGAFFNAWEDFEKKVKKD